MIPPSAGELGELEGLESTLGLNRSRGRGSSDWGLEDC
jgi:hypothetical protein